MSTHNRDSFPEVEEFHSSIGDVVVYYELNKNFLRYLGLVQEVENENTSDHYLQWSGENKDKDIITDKTGDKDITSDKIMTVLKAGKFSVNSECFLYFIKTVLPNLSM